MDVGEFETHELAVGGAGDDGHVSDARAASDGAVGRTEDLVAGLRVLEVQAVVGDAGGGARVGRGGDERELGVEATFRGLVGDVDEGALLEGRGGGGEEGRHGARLRVVILDGGRPLAVIR